MAGVTVDPWLNGTVAIDVTTAAQAIALRSLRDRAEARWALAGGPTFPIQGTDIGPGPHAPAAQTATLHFLELVAHPSVAGRRCLLMHPTLAAHLAAEIAACQAKVTAGTATALDTAIASLPAAAQIDNTWNASPLAGQATS